jgi:deazaflavin-dependent oxidoreductase (nitroreductase family)
MWVGASNLLARNLMDERERAAFNQRNIAEFRASGGTIESFGDAPVLLLTTKGRRSGEPRTSPLMYLADEDDRDRVYVFASAAGASQDPAWLHNLVATPDAVTVEIGRETFKAGPEVLPEERRAAIYAIQAERYPGFAGYQAKTSRRIPVVALTLDRGVPSGSER